MATAKDIKRLLKKKALTGEEVGRLMVLDLLGAYENYLDGRETHLLSNAEKDSLVNGLESSRDIKAYNNFKGVHSYLTHEAAAHESFRNAYLLNAAYLYHLMESLETAESVYRDYKFQPRIMTESQYQRELQKDRNEKLALTISAEGLFFHTLHYFLRLHAEGNQTPISPMAEASKHQNITRQRILDNYWEEGTKGYYVLPDGRSSRDMSREEWQQTIHATVDDETPIYKKDRAHTQKLIEDEFDRDGVTWVEDPRAPDDATMFDVLEYAENFYYSEETENKDTFAEFMEDFPNISAAVISHLAASPSLKKFAKVVENDPFNEDAFKVADLYADSVADYRNFVDTFSTDKAPAGVAVMQANSARPNNIDANGDYRAKLSVCIEFDLAERFLGHTKPEFPKGKQHHTTPRAEAARHCIAKVKYLLSFCLAREAFLEIVGEFIKVKGVEKLISPVPFDYILLYNRHVEDLLFLGLRRYGLTDNERPPDELVAELKEVLQPINTRDLRPTEEAIAKVRETLSFETFKGGTEDMIALLQRTVE